MNAGPFEEELNRELNNPIKRKVITYEEIDGNIKFLWSFRGSAFEVAF